MVTSSLSGFPMFTDGRMSRPGGVQVYGALYSHLLTVHCTLVRRKRNCWAPGGAGSCDGQGQDASATRARKQERPGPGYLGPVAWVVRRLLLVYTVTKYDHTMVTLGYGRCPVSGVSLG